MRLGAQNGPSTGSNLAPWRDLENVWALKCILIRFAALPDKDLPHRHSC